MPQIIRIKRRIGNATAPTPAQVTAGELAYHRIAAAGAGAGPDNLYVGDGTGVHLLVGAARQVEIAGPQTVTGTKTFSIGAGGSLSISGGAGGNVLTTDGAGVLSWAATPPATVQVTPPVSGDGGGTPLGVTPATTAQIIAGTDIVFPINSAGLRNQMGAAANSINLGTTAATVVPAIKELADKLTALAGPLNLCGTYDASTNLIDQVTLPAPPSLAGQPLPAADAANDGWFFIVTVQGTGTGEAPPVTLYRGDWVLSLGTEWVRIPIGPETITAINVGFTPIAAAGGLPGVPATNVQLAINQVYTQAHTRTLTLDPDGALTGGGIIGDPLSIAFVEAGTF